MAGADASIYGMIQPVRPVNRLAQAAQMAQLDAADASLQRNQLELAQAQRGVERQNKLAEMLSTGADAAGLRRGGFLKEANDWEKQAADAAKDRAAVEKTQLETARERVGITGQVLAGVKDPQSYAIARQTLGGMGFQMPEQFDPAFVQAKIGEATTIQQRIEQVWKDRGYELDVRKADETARHNRTTEQNAAGQLAVSQSNLGLRRQELELSKNQPRGQFIETTNGYVLADPKSGEVRPVMGPDGQPLKGKAADRSLNETQAKANLFGTRMQESNRILSDLEEKGVTNSGLIKSAVQGAVGLTPFIGDKLSDAAGSVLNTAPGVLGGPSGDQQRVDQARRDFINAALRRESGAAIAASEFANADRQYFPQPGDSKEVIAQKRRNRELAIKGLEVEVPGGFRSTPTGASPTAATPAAATPAAPKVLRFDANGNPV